MRELQLLSIGLALITALLLSTPSATASPLPRWTSTVYLGNPYHFAQLVELNNLDTQIKTDAQNIADTSRDELLLTYYGEPSVSLNPFPKYTNDNTPIFTGTATTTAPDTSIDSVEYMIDNGSWISKYDPNGAQPVDGQWNEPIESFTINTLTLSNGLHTITVRAFDEAGNYTAPANYATATFIVDTIAPSIALTPLSPDPTNDNTPTLIGTATDATSPITSVEYRVDSRGWIAAEASDGTFDELREDFTFTMAELDDGEHLVQVRATDGAGNISPLVSDAFTVDNTAPSLTLNPFPSYTNDPAPAFGGTATDTLSPIASMQYRLDGGAWTPATIVDGVLDELTEEYAFTTTALVDSPHTVEVRAWDALGNTTTPANYATATFIVDTTPPTIALAPLSPDPTNDNTPTLSGTAIDTTSPITSAEYRIDSGEWIAAEAIDGTFDELSEDFTFTMAKLDDGEHLVQVRATDAAGNISPLGSHAFIVDTTPPSLALNPFPSYTNDNTPTLSGLATDTTSPIASVEYRVDSRGWIAAEAIDGTFDELSEDFTFTMAKLDDGEHLVQVRATDGAGNISPLVSDAFTVDNTAPSLTLNPFSSYTNDPTPAFNGTATDTLSPIASVQYRLDSGAWTPTTIVDGVLDELTEEYTFTTTTLADDPHTLEVRAWDALENTTTPANYATATFTVDTTPPSIALTPLSPDPTNDNTPTLSGIAIDTTSPITSVEYKVDNRDWITAEAIDGTFDELSEDFTFTMAELDDGEHLVEVRATDAVGNTTTLANDTFIVDTALPSVTMSDIPDSVNQLASISGTASDDPPEVVERVQVLISNSSDSTYWDGAAWVTIERWLDAAGAESWSYNMPTLTGGKAYTVKAKSIDRAGNESIEASDSFTFDITPPVAPELPSPEPPSPEQEPSFLDRSTPWLWLIVSAACGLTLVIVLIRRGKAKV